MLECTRLTGGVDPGWVASLYEAHGPELAAYVWRTFGGRVSPDDVVHDAFDRLIRATMAAQGPRLVRPWLYRVAHNIGIDELRRRAHAGPQDTGRLPIASLPSAEADYETAALDPDVQLALAALSIAGRTAILMAAEGYSSREIATAIGRSDLATRALLCRTRKLLRGALVSSVRATEGGQAPGVAA